MRMSDAELVTYTDRSNLESGHGMNRRKWMVAATAVTAFALGGAGWTAWRRIQAQPVLQQTQMSEAGLDLLYSTSGSAGIAALLSPATGSNEDAFRVLDWIVARSHVALYGQLVVAMNDTRFVVRQFAVDAGYALPRVALRPFLSSLDAFAMTEADLPLRKKLIVLAKEVRAA